MPGSMIPSILRLDVTGFPVGWMPWEEAVCLYVKEQVAWEIGERRFTIQGGTSRITGRPSNVVINSIVAVHGTRNQQKHPHVIPHLTNRELFRRDRNMCMYCGQTLSDGDLTREHIIPRSRGGQDRWANVVACCRWCNTKKGGRTPEEANMQLLAIPFIPNPAEYLALKNRRILADQMEFLKKQFRHDQLLDLPHSNW